MVQLRDVIDPKQHYKKNDTKGVPKFFQVRIGVFKIAMPVVLSSIIFVFLIWIFFYNVLVRYGHVLLM